MTLLVHHAADSPTGAAGLLGGPPRLKVNEKVQQYTLRSIASSCSAELRHLEQLGEPPQQQWASAPPFFEVKLGKIPQQTRTQESVSLALAPQFEGLVLSMSSLQTTQRNETLLIQGSS